MKWEWQKPRMLTSSERKEVLLFISLIDFGSSAAGCDLPPLGLLCPGWGWFEFISPMQTLLIINRRYASLRFSRVPDGGRLPHCLTFQWLIWVWLVWYWIWQYVDCSDTLSHRYLNPVRLAHNSFVWCVWIINFYYYRLLQADEHRMCPQGASKNPQRVAVVLMLQSHCAHVSAWICSTTANSLKSHRTGVVGRYWHVEDSWPTPGPVICGGGSTSRLQWFPPNLS